MMEESGSPTLVETMSIEELQSTVAFEEQRHLLEMETLLTQKSKLWQQTEERKQHFQRLMHRLTEQRIALSELESNLEEGDVDLSEDTAPAVDLRTPHASASGTSQSAGSGVDRVDELMDKFFSALAKGKNTLPALLTAMDFAVQPEGTSPIREGKAFPPLLDPQTKQRMVLYNKTTNIFFVSRNSQIRGLRPWWEKHVKNCTACANRAASSSVPHPAEIADDKHHVGSAALPDLVAHSKVHQKKCHVAQVYVSVERCLDDREEEMAIDIWRVSAILFIQRNGAPLQRPSDEAAEVEAVLRNSVNLSLSTVVKRVLEGSWMESADVSPELHVAIEVFLHSIGASVAVGVAEQRSEATALRISLAVHIPVHAVVIQPLIEVVKTEAQQKLVLSNVVDPVVTTLCRALGFEERATFASGVATKFLAMFQSFRTQGHHNQEAASSSRSISTQTPGLKKRQAYNVLHALALHQSRVHVTVAVPRSRSIGLKQQGLDVVEELLHLCCAPSVVQCPSVLLEDALAYVVRIEKFPTNLLEALNKTFSSSDRIPAGRRMTAMDSMMSPQTKISLGLKLYSEMVVDVFRPYAPSCGAVIVDEEEKSQSFFKKSPAVAPPCTPRADLPPDVVRSNLAIHEEAVRLLERLDSERHRSEPLPVEEKGSEAVEQLKSRLEGSRWNESVRGDFKALGISISGFYQTETSFVLPFGLDVGNGDESLLPILYLNAAVTDRT